MICVLNRKGRATLLACHACGEVARCEVCDRALAQLREGCLRCRSCGATRPSVCAQCGSQRLRALRPGVARLRDDLAALSRRPVVEVSGESAGEGRGHVVVGTEAALHRAILSGAPRAVVFLDFDAELLAATFHAGERALALLARAARLVGGRSGGGRLVVQTRSPGHPVLAAALHADPGRLAAAEENVRRQLQLPPFSALALVSGPAAAGYIAGLEATGSVEVRGPDEGQWLVRGPNHRALCDALAGADRPPGRLRVEVDPKRA